MNWINVQESLPEEGRKVLTIDARGPIELVEYRIDYIILFDEGEHIWACRYDREQNEVTHWMPLPEPPKQNSED